LIIQIISIDYNNYIHYKNIEEILKYCIKFYTNNTNKKFEGKGKIIRYDGTIYIGQIKNGLPNGKGIKYYKNGNVLYEGDWINDKAEGNGKYIFYNGDYYIGQFKNGFPKGKGIIYSKKDNILYEGDLDNDINI